jgi:ribosomal protein S18 acetylase RimI-like enzyme
LKKEKHFIYRGGRVPDPGISPTVYQREFLEAELDLESEVFHRLRMENDIKPYDINLCNREEQESIESFFGAHKNSFFLLFEKNRLVGSVLLVGNYIQSLAVAKQFQRQGYGTKLTKYAINHALDQGYSSVELNTLPGNTDAEQLYMKLGFIEAEVK